MLKQSDTRFCQFKHPFTAIVAGPTGSGKTVLSRDLIENFKYTTTIDASQNIKVVWCYGQWQKGYELDIPNASTKYHEGLIDQQALEQLKPDLIVIDDLMKEVGDDPRMAALFTKVSHHLGISVVFIVQNLFHQSKEMRTISLNAHYLILLKNPRDKLQLMHLGRQLFPGNNKYFKDAVEDATKKPFSHVLLDTTSLCPDYMRIRSLIKQRDGNMAWVVYVPRT